MNKKEDQLPDVSISKDQIEKDLKFLERDLKRQLKDSKVKEFWNNTLGETLASGKIKLRGDSWHKDIVHV